MNRNAAAQVAEAARQAEEELSRALEAAASNVPRHWAVTLAQAREEVHGVACHASRLVRGSGGHE